ncbi:phosphatase [Fusobacterium sp. PH5-44]|uniref:phosphatase n=1 Tax=unclassified Fusobacterium TaxID=2648384 RepID=UPI003D1E1D97
MDFKIDLHMHTNSTPHAYSTFEECIDRALKKKMKVIAITNHGPALPDSPHWWTLRNMVVFPKKVEELVILKGVEANILDENGKLDINNDIYKIMDIVLAGFHPINEYGETNDINKNTISLINLMKNQQVDIITHPGNPGFPIDYEKIVENAKKYKVALELNNSSFYTSRKGSAPNCEKILSLCKDNGNTISLGSDAHISYDIGNFKYAIELLEKYDFPTEKIINTNIELLTAFLAERKAIKPKKI